MKSKKICLKIIRIGIFVVLALFSKYECKAAGLGNNWISVPKEEGMGNPYPYYFTFGKLSIGRTENGIYIERRGKIPYYSGENPNQNYGGVLTNGKDIIFQDGTDVYLAKNGNGRVKLASFSKKEDNLVAVYGNDIYFGRDQPEDSADLFRYNRNTKKTVSVKTYNGYYCYHENLIIKGQFHEGTETPLVLYNMKTKKKKTIVKKGIFGNAAVQSGTKIFYSEYNQKSSKMMSYDTKTGKKKTYCERKGDFFWLDRYHYFKRDTEGYEQFTLYDVRSTYFFDTNDDLTVAGNTFITKRYTMDSENFVKLIVKKKGKKKTVSWYTDGNYSTDGTFLYFTKIGKKIREGSYQKTICQYNLNTGKTKKICSGADYSVLGCGGKYVYGGPGYLAYFALYAINTENKKKTLINDDVSNVCVINNTVFATFGYQELNNQPIYACRLDGTGVKMIANGYGIANVSESRLYYFDSDYDETSMLIKEYSCSYDGKNKAAVSDVESEYPKLLYHHSY